MGQSALTPIENRSEDPVRDIDEKVPEPSHVRELYESSALFIGEIGVANWLTPGEDHRNEA